MTTEDQCSDSSIDAFVKLYAEASTEMAAREILNALIELVTPYGKVTYSRVSDKLAKAWDVEDYYEIVVKLEQVGIDPVVGKNIAQALGSGWNWEMRSQARVFTAIWDISFEGSLFHPLIDWAIVRFN